MPIIPKSAARPFALPGIVFTSIASPSTGTRETSIWTIEIAPGTPAAPHQLSREEILVVLSGSGTATLDGEVRQVSPGDVIAVPPDTDFSLANDSTETFKAMAMIPAGAEARMQDGASFIPPWFA